MGVRLLVSSVILGFGAGVEDEADPSLVIVGRERMSPAAPRERERST